jgi:FHA domain
MKMCPHCHFANPIDATFCARCSVSLIPLLTARVTPSVPEQAIKPSPPKHDEFIAKLQPDMLLLMVAGTGQPIYFKKSKATILGREMNTEAQARIDLTAYDGLLLGVSRQHVSIEATKTGYSICDLESTNGTWLNGVKLVPHRQYKLESGNLLRLGQMGVYVYFQTKVVTTIKVTLTDLTASAISLTPEYLTTKIGPYLIILSEIHDYLDTLLERTKLLIAITKLYWDPVTYQVHVDLRMDDELLHFVGLVVSKWKTKYESEIRKIWEMEADTDWLTPNAQSDTRTQAYEALQQQLHAPLMELVQECLDKLAPELSETEKAISRKRLLPVFYRLIRSPLQLLEETIVEYSAQS